MKICIGIPAYKAQNTIEECLSSINIQTIRDEINVVISNDNPELPRFLSPTTSPMEAFP